MEKATKRAKRSHIIAETGADLEKSRLGGAIVFFLCAIPVLSTIAYGAVDFWALSFLSVLSAVLCCLWVADAWSGRALLLDPNPMLLPLGGLILIGLVQLLPLGSGTPADLISVPAAQTLSLDPYATRLFIIHLIIYGLFFAAALSYINDRHRFRKIVLFVVIFIAIMAFFGILQRLASLDSIYGLRLTPQAIPFGSFVNQHHFAALMEMASGLTLGLLFGKATKKANRPLLMIAAVLIGIAIIFTGSRGGLISFICVVGFILAINLFTAKTRQTTPDGDEVTLLNGRPRLMMIAGGAALIFFIFAMVLLLGGEESALRGVGLHGVQVDFTTGRSHFWSIALQIFMDHPILGAGLDAFGNAFPQYDNWNGALRVQQAHNDYLQILADAGIAGFLCMSAFIFLLFKNGFRMIRDSEDVFRRNAAIGALAGCFGILVHSFFDFPLRTPANAFFFLLLAALATVSIYYPPRQRKV
jgi:O-antigen ligase